MRVAFDQAMLIYQRVIKKTIGAGDRQVKGGKVVSARLLASWGERCPRRRHDGG